jgi:hypothetical protein
VAFKKLNIEAYPNPTPVILEITAQAPGLSAEEMERYYTRPIEIGLYTTPGIDNDPLDLVLWPGVCPGDFQVWRGLSFVPTSRRPSRFNKTPASPVTLTPTIQAEQHHRGDISL